MYVQHFWRNSRDDFIIVTPVHVTKTAKQFSSGRLKHFFFLAELPHVRFKIHNSLMVIGTVGDQARFYSVFRLKCGHLRLSLIY